MLQAPNGCLTCVGVRFLFGFAIVLTMNKSQGQTLHTSKLCVYLPKPVFSHGTSQQGLKFLIKDDRGVKTDVTQNIVYKEIINTL